MYYIYEIINNVTGRRYIGQTIDHQKRFVKHMFNLKRGTHTERLMQRDYVLYGEDSFSYRIIDLADTHKEAIAKEKRYMILGKTYEDDYGYNSQDTYFNKYQNNKPPINSQNYFYKHIKSQNITLTELSSKLNISLRTLIRNLIHPRMFSVSAFKKLIDVLNLDKKEIFHYMKWPQETTTDNEEYITKFKKLSSENQLLILNLCDCLIQRKEGV